MTASNRKLKNFSISRRNQLQEYVNHTFQPDDWIEIRRFSRKDGGVAHEWHHASEHPKHQGCLHIGNTGIRNIIQEDTQYE